MRDLQVKDVFAVAKIFSKVSRNAIGDIAKAIDGHVDEGELGLLMITRVFTDAEPDLKAWLASLCEVSVEEFSNMPAVELLNIIKQLMEKEDVKDFFAQVSALLSGLKPKTKS